MDNQNKLEMFAQTIYAESMAEREHINDEIEKRTRESMDKCEIEALTRAYERIRGARASIEKEYAERLNTESFEKRRSFIAFRESLVDSVFADVEKRLAQFARTDEYKHYLQRSISEGKAMGSSLCAEISGADAAVLSEFIAENGIKKINTADIKGGIRIIVEDKGIVIDKSFDTALRDMRAAFNLNQ